MALTDEIQKAGGSTKQELYDRKISWWFEDEKDLRDDLESDKRRRASWTRVIQIDKWVEICWATWAECFICKRKNFMLNSFIYTKSMKRFKYRSDMLYYQTGINWKLKIQDGGL